MTISSNAQLYVKGGVPATVTAKVASDPGKTERTNGLSGDLEVKVGAGLPPSAAGLRPANKKTARTQSPNRDAARNRSLWLLETRIERPRMADDRAFLQFFLW